MGTFYLSLFMWCCVESGESRTKVLTQITLNTPRHFTNTLCFCETLGAVSRSDAERNVHRAGRQEGKFLSSLQLEPAPHEDRLKSRRVLLASDCGEEGFC